LIQPFSEATPIAPGGELFIKRSDISFRLKVIIGGTKFLLAPTAQLW